MTPIELAESVRSGDRRALAKAITLVESTLREERAAAAELLTALAAPSSRSFRIGVTGVPGAGKSTLIDALGCQAVAAGARVAVLAIDPSSQRSGGSVLGDKTRMARLSGEPHAFIRPSPTRGVLGGTAGHSREAILLCEAAGYDLILVETVGVGQSEERVADMVDCVLLLLLAGAGDEVSSMKRGVLEAADLIAFNKADGERVALAEADAASLRASLSMGRAKRLPLVLTVSALDAATVTHLWLTLGQHRSVIEADGSVESRRSAQRTAWFDSALNDELCDLFTHSPQLQLQRAAALVGVNAGTVSAPEAARRLVEALVPTARDAHE